MKKFFAFMLFILSNHLFSQIGWVGNIYPNGASSVDQNVDFNIYFQVFKAGVTDMTGQGAGISCKIHYGQVTVFGGSWSNVTDISMTYNTDIGNNDEYKGVLNLSAGLYEYTCGCTDNGGTSWSWSGAANVQLTVNAPLPVKFGAIEAVKDQNGTKISWATFSEAYSDYFDVQYSADGKYFTSVGRVKSLANGTQEALYYDFVDQYRDHSTIYYRIKQVDFDGKFTYSPMISLRKNVVYNDVKIFPNPTRDVINVTGVKPTSSLTIFDMNGRIVKSFTGGQSSLDIQELTAGVYILEILDEDGRHFYKVIRD